MIYFDLNKRLEGDNSTYSTPPTSPCCFGHKPLRLFPFHHFGGCECGDTWWAFFPLDVWVLSGSGHLWSFGSLKDPRRLEMVDVFEIPV